MYICSFCNKECKNEKSLKAHERLCPSNPNRTTTWNAGKTKETCETIRRQAENFSARIAAGEVIGGCGRRGDYNTSCRADVRKKVSEKMMGNHNNNPNKTGKGKKGWYKGFFCSSTYELAYVIFCLDHNIPIARCTRAYDYTYKGKAHKYYPDFIVNNSEIVEIKGFWTEVVDIKTKAVDDMPIKVLYHSDLKDIFDYIYSTYNKKVDKNLYELYEDIKGQ